MFSVTKRALKQVGDRNEGGGGRDRGGRGDFVPRGVEHDLAERVPPHLEHLGPPDRLSPRALLLLQGGRVLSVLLDGLADDVHPVLAARVLVVGVQYELFLAAGQLGKKSP